MATATNGARSSATAITSTDSMSVNTSAGRFSMSEATTSGASASGTANSDSPATGTIATTQPRTASVITVNIASMPLSENTHGSSMRRYVANAAMNSSMSSMRASGG